jgi:hypothetical protein
MAAIVSPQVARFANEKARVLANLIERTRRTAEQFAIDVVGEFEDHTGGNANGDVVVDGAAEDGRSIITKGDILGLKFVAEQLVTALTEDDREDLIAAVSTDGTPAF